MTKFVQGVKSLFTGADDTAQQQIQMAKDDSAKQREAQQISLERQRQESQNAAAEADDAAARSRRGSRGRRLLLAATGEQGVTPKNETLG